MEKEKTVSSQEIFSGKVVNLKVDVVQVSPEKTSIREIVLHPGGVCAVGITDQNKILLVKQYRKAVGKEVLELPAGKLEPGEDPIYAISREFKEETGYSAKNIRAISSFYASPGFTNETSHLFFLHAHEKGETSFDEDEDIEIFEYSLDQVKEMIYKNEIIDAKTIVGIMMYSDYISKR